MSTFGVIISGRPILTDAQVVSPTQLAYQIPAQPSFSHIVVFLLPGAALPDGTAAAVYAQLPGRSEFSLLGAIANEKPSAIFKVRSAGAGAGGDAMVNEGASAALALGISLEPAAQVAAALEQKSALEASTGAGAAAGTMVVHGQGQAHVDQKVLAQRIIKNCYDFLTSWGSGDTVPLKAFQAWWTKFEGKIARDPGFLERSDGG
ncbi:DUF775-domain-containing protein [Didymella exigua CBS 183.55]|uniref:DUF775-domain-containing protein n=1 Tax=Didymella exigua CBS 183.55 TaxID=1150837 RepID=A0A6A5RJW8_9PLEO|nr:DUF775-domain-containing protein [Didymella exigua CBS 183.55]KAF1928132.1 DUF775-domain-containing protein [Didymella exigua CBS 183.55]